MCVSACLYTCIDGKISVCVCLLVLHACVHLHMSVHVCVQLHVCVHACRGQKTTSAMMHGLPCFFENGSLTDPESDSVTGKAAQDPPFSPPGSEVTSIHF